MLIAFSVIILASCSNSSGQNDKTKETVNKVNEPAACYEYSKDSNKVIMHITITDNIVTGDLMYAYFEKDKNTGTIKGEMKGDTLFADYSFMSEGITSVRELAFLKKGNEWVEGYGEAEEQAGKVVFKNKAALAFDSNMALKKCSQ